MLQGMVPRRPPCDYIPGRRQTVSILAKSYSRCQARRVKMKPAVVLLSGGVDSATTLAIARNQGFLPYALSFAYGQRHSRELESATRVAAALGAKEPPIIYELMDLYPQGRAGRPSVLYVPVRRERDLPREFGGSEPPGAPEEK